MTDVEDELGDDETTSQAMSARESNMSGLSGKSSRKSNSRRGSRMSSSKASSVGRSESKASRDSQAEESISQNGSNTNTEGMDAKSGDEEERTESESTLKEKKTKFITEIRIEEEQYIDTVLHISEKKIPEEFETAPCVFFLRNLETKLPGKFGLNPSGLSDRLIWFRLNMAERSEAKSEKQGFATKCL